MEKKLFDELIESLRQAAAHSRGEMDLPAEQIHFVGEPDPRAVRARLSLTQEDLAATLGITVGEVRDWEQGRTRPAVSMDALNSKPEPPIHSS